MAEDNSELSTVQMALLALFRYDIKGKIRFNLKYINVNFVEKCIKLYIFYLKETTWNNLIFQDGVGPRA